MSQAFVLGRGGEALMPCHPARARELLKKGRAVIHRVVPFVIRLKDRAEGALQPVSVMLSTSFKKTLAMELYQLTSRMRGLLTLITCLAACARLSRRSSPTR